MKTLKVSLEDIKLGVCITRGGYMMLYKGTIRYNNRDKKVNVKQYTGEEQLFLKEFEVLFKYKQENIIGLVGYCKEKNGNFIVYEHASNGSLDRYLSDTNFSWTERLKACIGIAKGLKFLHGGDLGQDVVVHRDIKSSNILLNKYWKAKICGFEFALTYPANKEIGYLTNDFVGSPGYCDPLYWKTHFLTKESDIYSFGVILFEILCGRLSCPEGFRDRSQFLDVMVQEAQVEEMVFEGIKEQIAQKSLAAFSTIAFQCLQKEREKRPTASEVVGQLQKALELQEAYEGREADFNRRYKEILTFAKSPQIYSRMVKSYIKDILSRGILDEGAKEDIIQDILQTTSVIQEPVKFIQEEDDDDLESEFFPN